MHYIEWAEEANPYAMALGGLSPSLSGASKSRTIFVDNSVRKFIVDGLLRASEPVEKMTLPAVNVLSAPSDVTQMRERKSKAEIQILKCANEVGSIQWCFNFISCFQPIFRFSSSSRCLPLFSYHNFYEKWPELVNWCDFCIFRRRMQMPLLVQFSSLYSLPPSFLIKNYDGQAP